MTPSTEPEKRGPMLTDTSDQPFPVAATPPPDTFTGSQVCRIVGITYRQLDYWARTGVLHPSVASARGSGTKRLYSFGDLRRASVLRRLLDSGLSLQRARRALALLGEDDACRWLVIGNEVVACADGELERVVRENGVSTIVDLGEEALRISA